MRNGDFPSPYKIAVLSASEYQVCMNLALRAISPHRAWREETWLNLWGNISLLSCWGTSYLLLGTITSKPS